MLNKKRITRLLSVEVCYSSYFSDFPQTELVKRALDLHEVPYMKRYDPVFLDSLLSLSLSNREIDTEVISRFLSREWKIERIDNIKLSILRVAISEFRISSVEKKNFVINEYVNLASVFLPIKEVGFINAMLDKLALKIHSRINETGC